MNATRKEYTLLFLLKEARICLAMKKRGFGMGRWNGFGGKVKPGETPEAATLREAEEECGIIADVGDLEQVAVFDFSFANRPEQLRVHTYVLRKWEGEPVETEEMAPDWFDFDAVPYEHMWVDDIHWLPRVIKGERFEYGSFHLSEDESAVLESELCTL